ncbi:MAG: hypothetical protein AAF581_05170 [Planctomycetota bacterium]
MLKCPAPRLWIIPAVLLLMAVVQRYHAEVTHLHPWKGGGFGMFAAVPPTHLLTMKTQDGKFYYKTPTPDTMRRAGRVLSTHPTPARCEQFGAAILEQDWVLIPGADGNFPVTRDRASAFPSAQPVTLKEVTLDISQYVFDKKTSQMRHAPLLDSVTVKRTN